MWLEKKKDRGESLRAGAAVEELCRINCHCEKKMKTGEDLAAWMKFLSQACWQHLFEAFMQASHPSGLPSIHEQLELLVDIGSVQVVLLVPSAEG